MEGCLSAQGSVSEYLACMVPGIHEKPVTLSGLLPPLPSKTVPLLMGLKGLES